jgi:hypothetical protein
MSIQCPKCRKVNMDTASHCTACGQVFQKASQARATQAKATPARADVPLLDEVQKFLGLTEVSGKVINVHPTYFVPPSFSWGKAFLVLLLLLFLLYLVMTNLFLMLLLGALLVGIVVVLSFLNISATSILYGVLMLRSFSPAPQRQEDPVRDIILQSSGGDNQMVRITGQLVVGSVSMGDSITAKGRLKGGMLLFSSGYNHTLHSELRLKGIF